MKMTNEQIYIALENAVARAGQEEGEFGVFSRGFQLTYDPAREPSC